MISVSVAGAWYLQDHSQEAKADIEWTDQGLAGTPQGQIETCVHFLVSDLKDKCMLQKPKPFIRKLHTHTWPGVNLAQVSKQKEDQER